MHARNRTWLLGSDPAERCRQRTMPVEGGDGSTLSLDFTTGVLDPRLTFTRSTNATFINNSGYVEWAAANFITQSNNFAGSPWSSLNVTMSIDGSSPVGDAWKMLENNVSSLHRLDLTTFSYGNNGLSMTFSVYVKQGSGSRQAYFTISDNATGDIRSKRLNPVTGLLEGSESVSGSWTNVSTSVQSVGGGWYRLVFTATKNAGAAVICRTGMSDSSGNLSYAGDGTSFLYFAGCQMNPGTSAQAYNATTGSAYTAPRFDYDPTSIGTPRGLLIEGTASNLLFWSESFATSGAASNWAYNSNTGAVVTTDNPAGGTTAFQFAETANSGPLQQSATVTNVVHTFSAWFKGSVYNSVTTTQVMFGLFTTGFIAGTASIVSGPGSTSISANIVTLSGLSTTQWTRVQFTTSAAIPAGAVAILIYPQSTVFEVNRSFHIWGAQLEAGSGASSYIPTGASQGSRAADICYIPDGDHSWFTSKNNCVLFMQCEIPRTSNFGNLMYLGQWSGGEYSYGHQVYSFAATAVSSQTKINAATSTDQALFANQSVPINLKIAMCPNSDAARLARAWNGTASETTGLTPTASRFPAWTAQARFGIGTNAVSLGSSTACNIYVRTVKFFPFAMSNAQLQALTT